MASSARHLHSSTSLPGTNDKLRQLLIVFAAQCEQGFVRVARSVVYLLHRPLAVPVPSTAAVSLLVAFELAAQVAEEQRSL
ncbi:hypothetical protein BpHYR1_022082 [Brachionus plicatilis]|uniref:Uncharacterized protein n=1 Tax=Brachionus plicatilis TaxID=10195 RepID=A0A3M7S6G0_BRAPC|nr:hypothetical protein BpHYR1_022082 [Brachionus plicatilis]